MGAQIDKELVDESVDAPTQTGQASVDPSTYAGWTDPSQFDFEQAASQAAANPQSSGWTGGFTGNAPAVIQPSIASQGGGGLGIAAPLTNYVKNGIGTGDWSMQGFKNANGMGVRGAPIGVIPPVTPNTAGMSTNPNSLSSATPDQSGLGNDNTKGSTDMDNEGEGEEASEEGEDAADSGDMDF